MYVCMWKIPFGLDLGRNSDSISLKLDRMVGTIKNLNPYNIFGPSRRMRG